MQGLGFLESGITEPLNQFSSTLLEFSALLRHLVRRSIIDSVNEAAEVEIRLMTDTYYNRPIPSSSSLIADLFARQPRRSQAPGPEADGL